MPEGVGLRVSAILGSTGFQSELHLGALSVLFIKGFLMWMAACSVRSKWDLEGRDLRMLMSFQAILCPVVREWCAGADLILSRVSS